MDEEVGKLVLKFGVSKHEVNAAVYGQVLLNTVTLLNEANSELNSTAHYKFSVKAEDKGSFLSEIAMIAAIAIQGNAHLFTQENLELAKKFAEPIKTLVGKVLNLRKETEGERPTEVTKVDHGSVQIKGDNYGPITVKQNTYNMTFNRPESEKAIENIFKAANADGDIDEVAYLDENEQPLFEAKKDEFKKLTKKMDPPVPQKKSVVDTDAVLSIVRQSFEKDKSCDFIHDNRPISAYITDDSFWEAIDRGERFAKGDKLFVDLERSQEYDKSLDAFIDKAYKILKVNQHIPRPEQPNLFS